MTGLAVLSVSDQVETIDLLVNAGWQLQDWRPSILPYQENSIQNYDSMVDSFTLTLTRGDTNDLIHAIQDLGRLLQRGVDYWKTEWAELPTYLIAQAASEAETRYAVVRRFQMSSLGNPFGQPFFPMPGQTPALDTLSLQIEHGPWRSKAPGNSEDVDISAQGVFNGVTYGRATGIDYQPNFYPETYEARRYDMKDEWFVANRRNEANITHVKVFDTPAGWTTYTPASAFPWTLLPAVPANGDCIYFGVSAAVAADVYGPFDNLVFDIGTPIAYLADAGLIWEYWTGAAWAAIQDSHDAQSTELGVGTWQSFMFEGVTSFHWRADNVATVVDGVNGYWIRARVVLSAGAMGNAPTQVNRIIYSTTWNSITIDEEQLGGDIPNLLQINVRAPGWDDAMSLVAANDFRGHFDRVMVAARSVNRGPFTSNINYSDVQNTLPVFIDVTSLMATTTFAASPNYFAASGRCMTYNPAATAIPYRTEARFSITNGKYYKGAYHAFLRYAYTTGALGETKVKLRFFSDYVGNNIYETPSFNLVPTPAVPTMSRPAQVLDLGRVRFPPGDAPWRKDIYVLYIDTMVYHTNTSAAVVNFGDLILMPVDEWFADSEENLSGLTTVARSVDRDHILCIDSLTYPKYPIISQLVENSGGATGTANLVSQYNTYAAQPAHLQATRDVAHYPTDPRARGGDMQLFFFFQRSWGSVPLPRDGVVEACAQVTLRQVRQYKALRGDR